MKGKKILALASIFAGVALVGTTFADWVVTDNAAAKTIKISGEKIQGDTDERSYVTLSYGDSTAINDIANLAANSKRYAGSIGLVATYTGAESYKGLLTATLSQENKRTGEGAVNLIDYLDVKILDKAPTYDSETKIVSAEASGTTTYINLHGTGTPALSGSYSLAVTTKVEKPVYITVEMVEAAADAAILNTIKSDVVSLVLNWDHDSSGGQTIATGTTVYYRPAGAANDKVYCYAWKDKKANASDFPGVLMTKGADGVYYYNIDSAYDSFILSYNDSDSVNHQSRDFAVTEVSGSNVYWDGTQWTTKPVADETLTKEFYVVGLFNSWTCSDTYGMTQNNDHYELTGLVLANETKLKVRTSPNAAEEHWYSSVSTWEGCGFTSVDNEGNLVVPAGTYTVNYWPSGTNNNFVSLTKTA